MAVRCKFGEDTRSGSIVDKVFDTLDAAEGDGHTLGTYAENLERIAAECRRRAEVAEMFMNPQELVDYRARMRENDRRR